MDAMEEWKAMLTDKLGVSDFRTIPCRCPVCGSAWRQAIAFSGAVIICPIHGCIFRLSEQCQPRRLARGEWAQLEHWRKESAKEVSEQITFDMWG